MTSVTQTGYIWNKENNSYLFKSLPPIEFTYSFATIGKEIHSIDSQSLENLPVGIDGSLYQWVDLDGEGISGILTEQADAWFYKPNLGGSQFGPMEKVALKPSLTSLSSGRQQLMDLAGDGQLDLVLLKDAPSGFFERTQDQRWEQFTPFVSPPNINWNDPNLRFIDLTGDGHTDILITEDDVFTWYPSMSEEGFGTAEVIWKLNDEEKGPHLVFADATQSIYLADVSGDGLTDLVRIRNGEVCYWPNLGYGKFGAKVTMDQSPYFDYTDQFSHSRIRLADIDGTGTTDIIYLGRDSIDCYFNRSGNGWSNKHSINAFPKTDNLSNIMVVDLLGKGTACLVWSSPLPGDSRQPMKCLDLMRKKPHLLEKVVNNMGKETRFHYAQSTKFYLEDKEAGKPWITKLPFPVHVVERVETYDWISKNRFVTRYTYHHGYYDGIEREFRGFGMVEQWDTEEIGALQQESDFSEATNIDEASYVPPALTKTWFHTGAYFNGAIISRQFEKEYFNEDPQALLLDDTILLPGLTTIEEREACRGLKGQILRLEIYAEDGTAKSEIPYSVSERNYDIRLIQPVQDNKYAVFYTYPRETLNYHYERKTDDSRISHQINLEVDDFGNVKKSISIGYKRRVLAFPEQEKTLIAYTEADFTNVIDSDDSYRTPLPSETRTYELTGFIQSKGDFFTIDDFIKPDRPEIELRYDRDLSYEEPPTNGRERRLIECIRTLYYKNDLTGALSLGKVESLALPYKIYKMAFTQGLLTGTYDDRVNNNLLANEGKYLLWDGAYWILSGRQIFDADKFYLPIQFIDPFIEPLSLAYITEYDDYSLLIKETKDPLNNLVKASNDYRVMLPREVTDPNDNRMQVEFDALGMVIATAVIGKEDETDPEKMGDTLDDPTTRLEYDLFNWMNNKHPNYVHTFAREKHGPANPRWQESYSYSDGFGREIQKKAQAEIGPLVEGGPDVSPRWVGTGWTIFNNKGKPIKRYEPFFSDTYEFEFNKQYGVSSTLFYDPLERVMATLHPNHTYEKIIFDPWQQTTYDVNDTVLEEDPKNDPDVGEFFKRLDNAEYLPMWYTNRKNGLSGSAEKDAADKASKHVNTPSISHLDTLGRTFLTIADNGADEHGVEQKYETRIEIDIEGNRRKITDARSNIVMAYKYDMLSQRIYQNSMDAGERWILNNVMVKPLRSWDSRSHEFSYKYDELHRPTEIRVEGGDGDTPLDSVYEKIIYGEDKSNDKELNLRGKILEHYDTAGKVQFEEYDFKGNLLRSTRTLLNNYKDVVDWSGAPLMEDDTFSSSISYDALNRPTTLITPDKSVVKPIYNEANLLERLEVNLRNSGTFETFVNDIDYNAKGQRELIEYSITHGWIKTEYTYDPLTFRLTNIKTTRTTDNEKLQDLKYTYDPAGNITQMRDDAHSTIFYDSEEVEPCWKFVYDAIYRLIQAEGREHAGQNDYQPLAHWDDYPDYPFKKGPNANDSQAMRNYTERYIYDEVRNILGIKHQAKNSWIRLYDYEISNNRLKATSLPGDPDGIFSAKYTYDIHGNMKSMPHLAVMKWDFKDQLQYVEQGTTKSYYVYDSSGKRVRKVVEKNNGSLIEERIYLGGFEIYRKRNGAGTVNLERETLYIMDDKKRIALVETKTIDVDVPAITLPSTVTLYQLDNHLGSSCLEVNEDGAKVSYEEYHPYGTTSYQSGRSIAEVSLKRYRYTGKERDEESGLYYYGARYYSAWLSRWISAEPLGLAAGLNLFEYSRSNPVIVVDRSGKFWEWLENAAAAAAGAFVGAVEVLGQAVVGVGELAYEVAGAGMHEIEQAIDPNSDIWAEPAEHLRQTARSLRHMVEHPVDTAVSYVRSRGERFEAAIEAGDPFGAGQVIGTTGTELFFVADVAAGVGGSLSNASSTVVATPEGFTFPLAASVTVDIAQSGALAAGYAYSRASGTQEANPQEAAPAAPSAAVPGSPRPGFGETLVGSSRDQMRRAALRIISEDPHHPLRFLLDPEREVPAFRSSQGLSHADLFEHPEIVQMGHIRSAKLGEAEGLMLQGAWENQLNNISVEASHLGGAVLEQEAVSIGGIAVDVRTALGWEEHGWLPCGIVQNAPRVIY